MKMKKLQDIELSVLSIPILVCLFALSACVKPVDIGNASDELYNRIDSISPHYQNLAGSISMDKNPTTNTFPDVIRNFSIIGSIPRNDTIFALKILPKDKDGIVIMDNEILPSCFSISNTSDANDNPTIKNITEINIEPTSTNYYICMDNSAPAKYNKEILEQISLASKYFGGLDRFFLTYFNQNLGKTHFIPRSNSNELDLTNLSNTDAPSGFSAVSHSLLQIIHNEAKDSSVIILFANQADNSSIIVDENDVIEKAKEKRINIYVIALGEDIHTYNFINLANSTGGCLFYLQENKLDSIKTLIRDIMYSRYHYYEINVYAKTKYKSSEYSLTHNNIAQKYNFFFGNEPVYSEYQVIAAFDENSTTINEEYKNSINRLAKQIKNKQNEMEKNGIKILIVGHSLPHENNQIALKRAKIIKKEITSQDVKENCVITMSEQSLLPIFQNPNEIWQNYYNNRVEIRIIDPKNEPYEIILENVDSEERAEEIIQKWLNRDRNYKLYYQRIMLNGLPQYQVRLWGYKEKIEAELAMRQIQKLYRIKATLNIP